MENGSENSPESAAVAELLSDTLNESEQNQREEPIAEIIPKKTERKRKTKINPILSCCCKQNIMYLARNQGYRTSIIKYQGKIPKWEHEVVILSHCTHLACNFDLLFAAFTDETIEIIDSNTGIAAFPAIYIDSGVRMMQIFRTNHLCVVSHDNFIRIYKFSHVNRCELVFQQKYPTKLPQNIRVKTTYTTDLNLIPLIFHDNEIVYYSCKTNFWCLLSSEILNEFNDIREPETIYELKGKYFDQLSLMDKEFVNTICTIIRIYLNPDKNLYYKALKIIKNILDLATTDPNYCGVDMSEILSVIFKLVQDNSPFLIPIISRSSEYCIAMHEASDEIISLTTIIEEMKMENYLQQKPVAKNVDFEIKEALRRAREAEILVAKVREKTEKIIQQTEKIMKKFTENENLPELVSVIDPPAVDSIKSTVYKIPNDINYKIAIPNTELEMFLSTEIGIQTYKQLLPSFYSLDSKSKAFFRRLTEIYQKLYKTEIPGVRATISIPKHENKPIIDNSEENKAKIQELQMKLLETIEKQAKEKEQQQSIQCSASSDTIAIDIGSAHHSEENIEPILIGGSDNSSDSEQSISLDKSYEKISEIHENSKETKKNEVDNVITPTINIETSTNNEPLPNYEKLLSMSLPKPQKSLERSSTPTKSPKEPPKSPHKINKFESSYSDEEDGSKPIEKQNKDKDSSSSHNQSSSDKESKGSDFQNTENDNQQKKAVAQEPYESSSDSDLWGNDDAPVFLGFNYDPNQKSLKLSEPLSLNNSSHSSLLDVVRPTNDENPNNHR